MLSDKIKTRVWNPNQGVNEIKEFTAYEIVKSPNYHQPEAIIAAVCKVVSELADIELERREKINSIMMGLKSGKDEQVQI